MDVGVFLEPAIDLKRLSEILDGLGHEGRLHTVGTWDKKQQAALFEAAKGHQPLGLDFLVPASIGPLVEVIHEGRNTLPMFSHLQKRFAKLDAKLDAFPMGGFNHQTMSPFTGPGYFVVTQGEGEHEGELVLDYTKVPKSKPAGWPEIRPNQGPIASIVYGGMIDYLRGISAHVSIGRAHSRVADAWFTLVRKDVS
jgi:hypothetical protein